ncbi:MAG: SirB2 family protein [Psychrobium sp.]|nr:SirB2 family protein [Psychrobium sp.]
MWTIFMESMYLPIKHMHLSFVAFSVLFFVVRVALMFANKSIHQKKWAKITSRTVDTLLIITAIMLCIIINQTPFVDNWLTEKVIAVIAYIVLAYIALYKAETVKTKLLTSIGAVGWVLIAGKLAVLKQAMILG